VNLAGIPLAEHAALENIRDFLGHSSTLLVTRWRPGTGTVLTELPRTSRTAAGTGPATRDAARPGRRQAAEGHRVREGGSALCASRARPGNLTLRS
jgi:hypothetical protein